jgi:hypothetical protein
LAVWLRLGKIVEGFEAARTFAHRLALGFDQPS